MNIFKQFTSINRFVSAGYNSILDYECIQSCEKFTRELPIVYKPNEEKYKVDFAPYASQLNFTQPAAFIFHNVDHCFLNFKSSLPFVKYLNAYQGLDDFKLYRHETEPSLRLTIKYLLSNILPPIQIAPEPLLVIPGDMKCGFYHWIHDFLPALIYLKRNIDDFQSYNLFIPTVKFNYQYSTLQLLSIDHSKVLKFNYSQFNPVYIRGANKLISPLSVPGNPTPTTISLLKSEFFENILIRPPDTENLPRKFFVVRRKSGNNSQRVDYSGSAIDHLTKYGYSPILLEDLSFIDQCHLFANASSIISPHGAGLSLLFLASTRATVVEIQNSVFHNPCYWSLCNVSSVNYLCYDCYKGNKVETIDENDVSIILQIIFNS